jgi:membrane protein insertase Oxa1/YidC/SpoIIIJ
VSLGEILDSLFVESLLLIYGGVFSVILVGLESVGWALVGFSLALNAVLLPIYYQMERAKRANAERRAQMQKEIARMKAHYKGRERYYYIQTVHRVYGYRPFTAVFSSTDLYLQIVVFATVYRYLAGNTALVGASFGAISDLSKPDHLGFGLNLLPIAMTLLNVLSTLLYTKDEGTRRTAFLLAGLFLVLLYSSPSGIVLYWACNNAFSLLRTYVERKVVPLLPGGIASSLTRLAKQE